MNRLFVADGLFMDLHFFLDIEEECFLFFYFDRLRGFDRNLLLFGFRLLRDLAKVDPGSRRRFYGEVNVVFGIADIVLNRVWSGPDRLDRNAEKIVFDRCGSGNFGGVVDRFRLCFDLCFESGA